MADGKSVLIKYGASPRDMKEKIKVQIIWPDGGAPSTIALVPADIAKRVDKIKFDMDKDSIIGVVTRRISSNIVYTFALTTAASDGIRIAINPVFAWMCMHADPNIAKLKGTPDYEIAQTQIIRFLILHECFHQLYDHQGQAEMHPNANSNHDLCNIAMDAEINRDIEAGFNGAFKGCTRKIKGVFDERFPSQDWGYIFDQYYFHKVPLPERFQSPEVVQKKLYNVDNPSAKQEKQKIIDTQEHELVDADEDDYNVLGYNETIEKLVSGELKIPEIDKLLKEYNNLNESRYSRVSYNMFLFESATLLTPQQQQQYDEGKMEAIRDYKNYLIELIDYKKNGDKQPVGGTPPPPPPPPPGPIEVSRKYKPPRVGPDSPYDIDYRNIVDKRKHPQVNTTFTNNPQNGNGSGSGGGSQDPNNKNQDGQDQNGNNQNGNNQNGNNQNGNNQNGNNQNGKGPGGDPGNDRQKGPGGDGPIGPGGDGPEGPGNDKQKGPGGDGPEGPGNDKQKGPGGDGPEGPGGNKPTNGGTVLSKTKSGPSEAGKVGVQLTEDVDYVYGASDSCGGADMVTPQQMAEWAADVGEPYGGDELSANVKAINRDYNQKHQKEMSKVRIGDKTLADKVGRIMEMLAGRTSLGNWKSLMKKHLTDASESAIQLKRGRVRLGQEGYRDDYAIPYKEYDVPEEDSANVFYLIDNSGSMMGNGQDVFLQIFKEVLELEKTCNINTSALTYFGGNDRVNVDMIRLWNRNTPKSKVMEMVPQQKGDEGGGTRIIENVESVLRLREPYYYDNKDGHHTVIIVFTDGEDNLAPLANIPGKLKKDIVFCIINNIGFLEEAFKTLGKYGIPLRNIVCINNADY